MQITQINADFKRFVLKSGRIAQYSETYKAALQTKINLGSRQGCVKFWYTRDRSYNRAELLSFEPVFGQTARSLRLNMLIAAAGSAPSCAPAERYVGNTLVTYRPDGTKEGYFYLTLSCRHLSFVRKLYTPSRQFSRELNVSESSIQSCDIKAAKSVFHPIICNANCVLSLQRKFRCSVMLVANCFVFLHKKYRGVLTKCKSVAFFESNASAYLPHIVQLATESAHFGAVYQ